MHDVLYVVMFVAGAIVGVMARSLYESKKITAARTEFEKIKKEVELAPSEFKAWFETRLKTIKL